MEIQVLGRGEGPRLRAIRLRALRDSPEAYSSTFDETAMRPPEAWVRQISELATFVAVEAGRDIGLVRGGRDDELNDGAWLLSMWVAPEHRGKGVGEALIDAVVAWARSEGYTQLLLEVGDDNEPAIALYERKGFEPNGKTGSLPPPRQHVREHQRFLELRQTRRPRRGGL